MPSLNKVVLMGHLGKDPETRYMPSGGAVTNVSIATSEQWTDKTSGERKEKTEWTNLVFFGKVAEVAAQSLHKGSLIYVEGKLQTRKWADKDGQDRYTTEVVVGEMKMLDKKPGSPEQTAPRQQAAPQGGMDLDEEIPFAPSGFGMLI